MNLENGMSSKHSMKISKEIFHLYAEYANIKKDFTLPANPDKRLWTPLCPLNFEEILNFPNFDVAFIEELAWLCSVQQSFFAYAEDNEYTGRARYHLHFIR